MANTLYAKAKETILSAGIDLLTGTIKVALVKNTYPQNLSTDEFYSDISAYVLGTPQTLGTKSVTLGVFDAADVTYTAVTAGDTSEGVVIYKDTGVEATSRLICNIDTATAQSFLNAVNSSSPFGNVTYNQTGWQDVAGDCENANTSSEGGL